MDATSIPSGMGQWVALSFKIKVPSSGGAEHKCGNLKDHPS